MNRSAMLRRAFLASVCLLGIGAAPPANAEAKPLNLIPTSKSVTVAGGEMPVTDATRIVSMDKSPKPLAAILSDEILLVTKLRLLPAAPAKSTKPKSGNGARETRETHEK